MYANPGVPALLHSRNPSNFLQVISQLIIDPSKRVYAITSHAILTAIVQRLGIQSPDLSPEDLQLALGEVGEAISHNLDERDYIDMGLDSWEIVCYLKYVRQGNVQYDNPITLIPVLTMSGFSLNWLHDTLLSIYVVVEEGNLPRRTSEVHRQ